MIPLNNSFNTLAKKSIEAFVLMLLIGFTLVSSRHAHAVGVITTIAGGGTVYNPGNGIPATQAVLTGPDTMVADSAGNLYVNDYGIIYRIDAQGKIWLFAGGRSNPNAGDGDPAVQLYLGQPFQLALDGAGSLYIDSGASRIRKVYPNGLIGTVAGNGSSGFTGDGISASSSELNQPKGIALDISGNLYIADGYNNRIRKVTQDGFISTIAGNGHYGFFGEGGPATQSVIGDPGALAVDSDGTLYFEDIGAARICKIDPHGILHTAVTPYIPISSNGSNLVLDNQHNLYFIDTYAIKKMSPDGKVSALLGTGQQGYSPDGSPATTDSAISPTNFTLDFSGNIIWTEQNRVRMATGLAAPALNLNAAPAEQNLPFQIFPKSVTLRAGQVTHFKLRPYFPVVWSLDGPGTVDSKGTYHAPDAITSDQTATLTATALSGTSRTSTATISLIGTQNPRDYTIATAAGGGWGDGGPATQAPLEYPTDLLLGADGILYVSQFNGGVRAIGPDGRITTLLGHGRGMAMDASGDLYVTDWQNSRVRMRRPNGLTMTIAGQGTLGYGGDGGPATDASLNQPMAVAVDAVGNWYIADTGNAVIRKVTPDGTITTIAGTYHYGPYPDGPPPTGDNGPANKAVLFAPAGLAFDAAGDLLIADGPRIRKIDLQGIITTIAGDGSGGYAGDNGPAIQAKLYATAVAVDSEGDVFLAEPDNYVIRKINSHGTISTVAGNGLPMGSPDDGIPANQASLNTPRGVAVDTAGNIYIAETGAGHIRRVGANGLISTVAGNGRQPDFGNYIPDGAPATTPISPSGIASDGQGNLYLSDAFHHQVRKVAPDGIITTIAGTGVSGTGGDGGPATDATLESPNRLLFDSAGNLYISDYHQVRKVTPDGTISTLFHHDTGIFLTSRDASGNFYLIDGSKRIVLRWSPGGTLSTYTGNATGTGGAQSDNTPATQFNLQNPLAVAVDAAGNGYILDSSEIRKVSPGGTITTLKGQFVSNEGVINENPPATLEFHLPSDLVVDASGNLFVSDSNWHKIWKVDSQGLALPAVGNPFETQSGFVGDYSGDGASALFAELNNPTLMNLDVSGNLYFVDAYNHRVRVVYAASTSGIPPDAPSPPLQISPVSVGLQGGESQHFSLIPDTSVQWALSGKGIIDSDGTYHAPATVTANETVTLTAFTKDNSWRSGTAVVHLLAPLGITPADAGAVMAGQTVHFGLTPAGTEVIWTVDGGSANGNVDASGTYHAPSVIAGDHKVTLTATPKNDSRKPVSASLTLLASSEGELSQLVVTGVTVNGVVTPFTEEGKPALKVPFDPVALGWNDGHLYIATGDKVRRLNTDDTLTVIAGGTYGSNLPYPASIGDEGPATQAFLYYPAGITFGLDGSLYIADKYHQRIRKVDSDGIIRGIAGLGSTGVGNSGYPKGGFNGDDGPAKNAEVNSPTGMAVDSKGNLYIADTDNFRVRKIDTKGIITTFAGPEIPLYNPSDVAVDSNDNLYIADTNNQVIRKVTPGGNVSIVAGIAPTPSTNPQVVHSGYSGDNGPATAAALNNPAAIAIDAAGNLYIADTGNSRVRKVDLNGIISTVVGGGTKLDPNISATDYQLFTPQDLVLDPSGNLYIADSGINRVLVVSSNGKIRPVAGLLGSLADGQPARNTSFQSSQGLALDDWGNLYVATVGRIYKVNRQGILTTFAGNGRNIPTNGALPGSQIQDGDLAIYATLKGDEGIATDHQGNLYIAEYDNRRIRKVDTQGVITTVAGGGTGNPNSGVGNLAVSVSLSGPTDVALDSVGNLFIADIGANRVRKVGTDGKISTVAGGGSASGDNVPATSVSLSGPEWIATDASGNLYISEGGSKKIRKVDSQGTITTLAGGGTGTDGGLATEASLTAPQDVAVDSAGNVFFNDGNKLRVVRTNGRIFTVAGSGKSHTGIIPDGTLALNADLSLPLGLAIDPAGNVFESDYLTGVYKISSLGQPGLVASQPFVYHPSPGDVNQDGQVNAQDIILTLQFFLGLEQPTPLQLEAADVAPYPGTDGRRQGDGVITGEDLNWGFRRFLNLEQDR